MADPSTDDPSTDDPSTDDLSSNDVAAVAPPIPPSSWSTDDLDAGSAGRKSRLPLLVGVLVAVLAMVTAYIVIAKPFEVQKETMWPLDVGGRPAGLGEPGDLAEAVTPEVPVGAYLWNDFDGWHLWFVLDSTMPKVSGTIVSNDDIEKAQLTPAPAGTAEADGETLSFEISTRSNIAGIDFEPGFYSDRMEVRIETPSGPLPPEMVHRGRSAAVAALPLVVEKVPKPDGE